MSRLQGDIINGVVRAQARHRATTVGFVATHVANSVIEGSCGSRNHQIYERRISTITDGT